MSQPTEETDAIVYDFLRECFTDTSLLYSEVEGTSKEFPLTYVVAHRELMQYVFYMCQHRALGGYVTKHMVQGSGSVRPMVAVRFNYEATPRLLRIVNRLFVRYPRPLSPLRKKTDPAYCCAPLHRNFERMNEVFDRRRKLKLLVSDEG